jgi:LPS-assembly lipoprotein
LSDGWPDVAHRAAPSSARIATPLGKRSRFNPGEIGSNLTRRFAAALLCLLLGACGFQPLHGRSAGGVTDADLDTVQLPYLADREGQLLRNFLMQRFNPDGRRTQTLYALNINLTKSSQNLGVRKDGTATRVNLTFSAELSLRQVQGGKEVFKARSVSNISYNVLEARFATVAAEQDAIRRATEALAQNISTRVAIYLRNRKDAG